MVKIILAATTFILIATTAFAQPQSREELDKQRQQLKKEMEQYEKMLNENKSLTKESYARYTILKTKVDLQDRVIDNINKDINILDNNMYGIQKDINRYNKLLDTLKQEYAKSMVYAYKNRGDYSFLNFIFSASSFNDAVKRIAYLKSYRNYREMQGQNILRTQDLRKIKLDELNGTKQKKSEVLDTKDKEMVVLETQRKEQDRVLAELKKQGKQLGAQYAAKKKQMAKVDNAIALAIKKAMDDAIAAKKKADAEKARLLAIEKAKNVPSNPATTNTTKAPVIKTKAAPKTPESVLLNDENSKLNASFVSNRGSLPWPVDNGFMLLHFGANKLESGSIVDSKGISVGTQVGASVKAIFEGTVVRIMPIEDVQLVVIQHGKYFTGYSNIISVSVQAGQTVTRGQTIGKAAANLDGVGEIDFSVYDEKSILDPQKWLSARIR